MPDHRRKAGLADFCGPQQGVDAAVELAMIVQREVPADDRSGAGAMRAQRRRLVCGRTPARERRAVAPGFGRSIRRDS